jgi:hypothetical protein
MFPSIGTTYEVTREFMITVSVVIVNVIGAVGMPFVFCLHSIAYLKDVVLGFSTIVAAAPSKCYFDKAMRLVAPNCSFVDELRDRQLG